MSTAAAGLRVRSVATVGVCYALAAFLFWGANPIYFKAVGHVPLLEVLAHRVVWSVLLLAVLVTLARRWGLIAALLADRRACLLLVLTAFIISVNWLIYIWAIGAERVLETSLGYYINPLVNVLLGVVVLGERIGPWRRAAVVLAALGVINLALGVEGFPWVSLSLALTFGIYGLIRKMLGVGSLEGLLVETAMMLPFALAFLAYLAAADAGTFGTLDGGTDLLLILGGAVTAAPLIWFASAARRLDYSTVGFFQYIAPTCQFLLAVMLYGEPFTRAHLVTFVFIWSALAILIVRSALDARRRPPTVAPAG